MVTSVAGIAIDLTLRCQFAMWRREVLADNPVKHRVDRSQQEPGRHSFPLTPDGPVFFLGMRLQSSRFHD